MYITDMLVAERSIGFPTEVDVEIAREKARCMIIDAEAGLVVDDVEEAQSEEEQEEEEEQDEQESECEEEQEEEETECEVDPWLSQLSESE
eukprot:COSAG02_NODE_36752_length_451_cov_0.676136_1_plen_90_part_10